jgi:hypothetical protein
VERLRIPISADLFVCLAISCIFSSRRHRPHGLLLSFDQQTLQNDFPDTQDTMGIESRRSEDRCWYCTKSRVSQDPQRRRTAYNDYARIFVIKMGHIWIFIGYFGTTVGTWIRNRSSAATRRLCRESHGVVMVSVAEANNFELRSLGSLQNSGIVTVVVHKIQTPPTRRRRTFHSILVWRHDS